MSARPDTWMPLYIADYLADTMHLTRDEHGGYLLLIMAYWRAGKPLPDDDRYLATVTRCTAIEWRKLRVVLQPFFKVCDGVWKHGRIEDEIANSNDSYNRRYKQTEAARTARVTRYATSDVTSSVTETQPQPQPQSDTSVSESDSTAKRGLRLPDHWKPSDELRSFAAELGLDPDAAADEFRDYWRSVPGAKGRKIDWDATFRNRCRDLAKRPSTGARRTPTGQAVFAELAAHLERGHDRNSF